MGWMVVVWCFFWSVFGSGMCLALVWLWYVDGCCYYIRPEEELKNSMIMIIISLVGGGSANLLHYPPASSMIIWSIIIGILGEPACAAARKGAGDGVLAVGAVA